jgi:HEAT repeat protein
LKEFPGATTEEALIRIVNDDPDAFVKVQALTRLTEVGGETALPTIERAVKDSDSDIARNARNAVAAVKSRAK